MLYFSMLLIANQFPIVIFDITIADKSFVINILNAAVGQSVFDIDNLYYQVLICNNTKIIMCAIGISRMYKYYLSALRLCRFH